MCQGADWWLLAACRGTYDARFFGSQPEQREVRLLYCVGCPVVDECGRLREDVRDRFGMWGGQVGKVRSRR